MSVWFWAGMRLAQWAADKLGGGSSGNSGHGGGGGGYDGDDIPVVAEGYLPGGRQFKWVAVPLSHAHRVRVGNGVWTCDGFVSLLATLARQQPHNADGYEVFAKEVYDASNENRGCAIFVLKVY